MATTGQLLVSTPKLKDSVFLKSVVFLIKSDMGFDIGVVINRTQNKIVKYKDLQTDKYLKYGGPIVGPIIAIHTDERLGEFEILPNLYYSCEFNNINKLINQKTSLYQLYSGYSCWGVGQIDFEISQGFWTLSNLDSHKILYEEDDFIWVHERHKYSKEYMNFLGIKTHFNYALN
jgi:putative transcriptional regulator